MFFSTSRSWIILFTFQSFDFFRGSTCSGTLKPRYSIGGMSCNVPGHEILQLANWTRQHAVMLLLDAVRPQISTFWKVPLNFCQATLWNRLVEPAKVPSQHGSSADTGRMWNGRCYVGFGLQKGGISHWLSQGMLPSWYRQHWRQRWWSWFCCYYSRLLDENRMPKWEGMRLRTSEIHKVIESQVFIPWFHVLVVLHHVFVECCCCNSGHKGVFFNVGNGTTANGAEMLCRTLPTKPAENASNSSCPPKYRVRRPGEGHLVSRSLIPRWWFQIFFMFIPIWGIMIQFDVHIFQMGWNSTTKTRNSDLCFFCFSWLGYTPILCWRLWAGIALWIGRA